MPQETLALFLAFSTIVFVSVIVGIIVGSRIEKLREDLHRG